MGSESVTVDLCACAGVTSSRPDGRSVLMTFRHDHIVYRSIVLPPDATGRDKTATASWKTHATSSAPLTVCLAESEPIPGRRCHGILRLFVMFKLHAVKYFGA